MALTDILVVSDAERSTAWYTDVLGAEVFRSYGSSVVLSFLGSWLLLVESGTPTEDKPGVTFAPPADPSAVSHSFTIRVQDCQTSYEELASRGAEFLAPPHDWGAEVRCFFRDPDGACIELIETPRVAGGAG